MGRASLGSQRKWPRRSWSSPGPGQPAEEAAVKKSSAPAYPTKDPATRLAKLEEKYRHELLPEDERLELRETIVRLRRRLGL